MKNRYVLDACALVAYLNDELGSDIIERILNEAIANKALLSMGKVNLLEVYYGIFRDFGYEKADEVLTEIRSLPIQIISDLSDDVFREAGRLKAENKISLADSLALGLAIITGDHLLTSDHHEFDALEGKEDIQFAWIR